MDPEDDDDENPYEPTTADDWFNPLAPDDTDVDSVPDTDEEDQDDDFGYICLTEVL